jgi:hypothetical protein
VIDHLNRELVRLKHDKTPTVMKIRRAAAVSMITRAPSKLKRWSPPIKQFRVWLIDNGDEVYK